MLPKRESETVEFKKTISELKEGIISIASMLNKNGEANLFFGIKNNGEIYGQDVGSLTTNKISNEIKNFIKPIIFPKIEIINISNKCIIKVSALGKDKPYSAYGRYYIRLDDQDLVMPQNDLEDAFINKNITYSNWENQLTSYDEKNINENQLIEYINKANEVNRLNYRYKDIDDAMTKLGLMVDGKLNNAGYYLFGNNKPLLIKLAIFATDERLIFIDNKYFEGNIFECIDESLKYVTSNIHYNAQIVGFERVEKPEIPIEALREIIINSYAHMRVTPGEYNEIIITPKRIRIYNPGTIALNKDPVEFASGNIGSKVRNPLIALTLYKNKSIEAFGTGFRRVFELCKSNNINYNYGIDGIGFYFEFFRNNASNNTINDTINDTNDTINDTKKYDLKAFENELYQFILINGRLNNIKVAMDEFNKSHITIQRAINTLVSKNLIKRVGSNKTGYWEIVK